MTAVCGAITSKDGKPFTPETLRQHDRDCPKCRHFYAKSAFLAEVIQPLPEEDDEEAQRRDDDTKAEILMGYGE